MDPEIFRRAKELAAVVSHQDCDCQKSHYPECTVGMAIDLDRLILNCELQQPHATAKPKEG